MTLRDALLRARLERERRVDLISFQGLHQKLERKRKRYSPENAHNLDEQSDELFGRRNKLIALTPDEIHHDLERVLVEVEKRGVPKQSYGTFFFFLLF